MLCALAISLDYKMIKNKGKHKKFLATNGILATCTQGAQFFFSFADAKGEERWIFWGFSCSQHVPQHVPNSTSLCAICFVPNVFLNMFPIAPHFVPYVLPSVFLSPNLYRWVTIWAFMFGVNNSIWGFFKVSNFLKKIYFILIFFL
jgi:hypothetical protein